MFKKIIGMLSAVFVFVLLGSVSGFYFPKKTLASQPKGEVTIAIANTFEMTGGDTHTIKAGAGAIIKNLLYDSLVTKKSDGRIYPALAKSWQIADDWSQIKFVLDERAKFHNGQPVTAEDVKFSFERAIRPELNFIIAGEMKRHIKNVEVLDKHNLIVHLLKPYPAFFDKCSEYFGIVPKAYVEKVGDAEFAQHPVGAGPFKAVSFQQDVIFTVEAVKDHYRQPPHVEKLILKVVPEPATRLAMLKTGEADIIQLYPSHIPEIEKNTDLRIQWSKYTMLRTLLFFDLQWPNKPSPWKDIRVRKAAAYAINSASITKNILRDAGEPWGDILAPYHPGYDPSIKPYPYNPKKAKELLAEAGYPKGFDTTLNASVQFKVQTQAIAADLAKVGIRAKLNIMEHGIWIKSTVQHKLKGLNNHPTPYWSGRNVVSALGSTMDPAQKWTVYSTPELEAQYKKLSVASGLDEQGVEAAKLSKMYREVLPRVNLWAMHVPYGVGKRVKYWENVSGWRVAGCFEYLELQE